MKDCVSQGKKSRMNNNADDLRALLKWKSNDRSCCWFTLCHAVLCLHLAIQYNYHPSATECPLDPCLLLLWQFLPDLSHTHTLTHTLTFTHTYFNHFASFPLKTLQSLYSSFLARCCERDAELIGSRINVFFICN